MNFIEAPLSAGLYLVATPIGTARDMTLRALDTLASADLILAEDTRTARKLMEIHGIRLGGRRMLAYHDHSGDAVCTHAVEAIRAGQAVACVSEAGTPLVADPGYEVAQAVIAAGLNVTAVPGPSALLAALSVAGLPTDRFLFAGFLPPARTQRQAEIAALRDLPVTLVFFESPKRVGEMLGDLVHVLGSERQGAICRELTKRFEEVRRGTLGALAEGLKDQPARGEVVVLVGRAGAVDRAEADIRAALEEAMKTMRIKDAATTVAGALGLPRRQVYQVALAMGGDE